VKVSPSETLNAYGVEASQQRQVTRNALAKANSQQDWNSFLLASPDLNYR
jgi:hypothetical protein